MTSTADDIAAKNLRDLLEKVPAIGRRIGLWVNSLVGIVHEAMTWRRDEPVLVWRLGSTEKHCVDCLDLNGQAMTASEWRAAGITPQSPDLACGGWNCDCRLEEA